jgi:site-specific DNA recombinase
MTPTHASRKGQRYRYYVSQKLTTTAKRHAPDAWRVPARDLEQLVWDRMASFLGSETELFSALESAVPDARERRRILQSAPSITHEWTNLRPAERRTALTRILDRIELSPTRISIVIDMTRVRGALSAGSAMPTSDASLDETTSSGNEELVTVTIPTRLKRAGVEMRFIIEGTDRDARATPDTSLHRLLAQAFRYRALLMDSSGASVTELAARAGVSPPLFTRSLKLSFLAPELVEIVIRDEHPLDLTAERLAKHLPLAVSWRKQMAQVLRGTRVAN